MKYYKNMLASSFLALSTLALMAPAMASPHGGSTCGRNGRVVGQSVNYITQCCRREADEGRILKCAAYEECKIMTYACTDGNTTWTNTGDPYSCIDAEGSVCETEDDGPDSPGPDIPDIDTADF